MYIVNNKKVFGDYIFVMNMLIVHNLISKVW